MRRWWWLVVMVLLMGLLAGPVTAQSGVRIAVDPNDTPLVIRGWIGEEGTFIGNLRLSAVGGDVDEFTFLASDLEREDGETRIGRQRLSMSGAPALIEGVPRDFQVEVTGVSEPGSYEGELRLLLPGQSFEAAVAIPVHLEARARPTLTPLAGTEDLRLRLVHCGRGVSCWFAPLFLPESAFLDRWTLQFDNPGATPVSVTDIEAVVLGEQTGYQLTEEALVLPETAMLPADGIVSLRLELNRAAMPPDRYTGRIYLTLAGRAERLSLPVDLNVRTGPFWPLLALLLGIVIGRLFKYMQERGEPQAEALQTLNALEVRIREAHPEDAERLLPMAERLRQAVYQHKLERIEERVAAIDARLKALHSLREIESALEGNQHPSAEEIRHKIDTARNLIVREQDAEAEALLAEIRTLLAGLRTGGLMRGEVALEGGVIQAEAQAAEALASVEQAGRAPRSAVPDSPGQARLKSFLVTLSGLSDQIRAEASLWLVRPLLYLALLLGLLAVGMNSLYLEAGATFGARPFADYLGLVLWGISADVASRSLANLQGGAG